MSLCEIRYELLAIGGGIKHDSHVNILLRGVTLHEYVSMLQKYISKLAELQGINVISFDDQLVHYEDRKYISISNLLLVVRIEIA
jgi:hypothetical protein